MRITHLGHACLLVEAAGSRILIDPGSFSGLWHEVTDLDAVLITHQHPDHVDPEHAPRLLERNPQAAVRTAEDVHEAVLLPGAQPVRPGQTFTVGEVEVEAVGGDHAVIHEDIPRIHNIGYLLRGPGEPVLFHPGDSLETAPAGVEVLALPIMGPWAAMKEQVEFVRALGRANDEAGSGTGAGSGTDGGQVPRVSIPIHDELLSDRGRALLNRQIGRLTGTEILPLRDGGSREFSSSGS